MVMTGGTGVLGSEMACALVRSGANVAILAREPARAGSLRERLEKGPGSAMLVQADIFARESLLKAAGEIQARFGSIRDLINAAGGNAPGATTNPGQRFFDLPEALRQVVDLNLLGTIVPRQVFERLMADGGNIINIASMAGFGRSNTVAYSASKAAVSNFTQWLAVHMAQNYSPRIRSTPSRPAFSTRSRTTFYFMMKDGI
jgi:NAD(P)-dependent dehydrogenase (short-subunit alcohol dehydrogenase family)